MHSKDFSQGAVKWWALTWQNILSMRCESHKQLPQIREATLTDFSHLHKRAHEKDLFAKTPERYIFLKAIIGNNSWGPVTLWIRRTPQFEVQLLSLCKPSCTNLLTSNSTPSFSSSTEQPRGSFAPKGSMKSIFFSPFSSLTSFSIIDISMRMRESNAKKSFVAKSARWSRGKIYRFTSDIRVFEENLIFQAFRVLCQTRRKETMAFQTPIPGQGNCRRTIFLCHSVWMWGATPFGR